MNTQDPFVQSAGPHRAAVAPPAEPEPAAINPGHVLVVEDDFDLRDILARSLREAGWRVSSAIDGEAGWAVLCAGGIDVVVTDHEMPRLTGLNLLRRVRDSPQPVPVVLIPEQVPWDEPDLPRLLPPGALLEKPFSLVELLAKIRTLWPPTSTLRERSSVPPATTR